MNTVADIISFVKANYRLSDTSLDSFITSQINSNYWARARLLPWRETIKSGTFTTSTTTQYYATSSDFARLVPNSIRYGVDSSSQGVGLPEILFEQYEYYRSAQTAGDPQWATLTGASSGPGKRILLFPPFTNSGSAVTYDYYATPASMSSASTVPVAELCDVVAYDTLADVAGYHSDDKRRAMYQADARSKFGAAFQSVLP
jgi:hypothetical protein